MSADSKKSDLEKSFPANLDVILKNLSHIKCFYLQGQQCAYKMFIPSLRCGNLVLIGIF